MKMSGSKAFAIPAAYWVAAGVIALGAFLFKPKALHGDSRRADQSTEATKELVAATDKKEKDLRKKSAEAAASLEVMDSVVETLPETLEKMFLREEGKVAKSKLEKPDPDERLASEHRKVLVLAGKLEESRKAYAKAFEHTKDLEVQLEKSTQAAAEAKAQREAVDLKFQQVAAERLGAERQRNQILIGAAALLLLYLYTKATHLSPTAYAELAKDLKSGVDGKQALDSVTSRLQQSYARFIQKHFHS